MKPFVAFPLVPFINHFPPLATSNIETILRSRGITHQSSSSILLPLRCTWTCPTRVHLIPLFLSLSTMNSRYALLPRGGYVSSISPRAKEETKPLFIARTWTKNSYYGVAVPLREISLSSCGDRIALTKSSKGGVKALARAQKKGRSKETKSIWPDSSSPLSPSSFLSRL